MTPDFVLSGLRNAAAAKRLFRKDWVRASGHPILGVKFPGRLDRMPRMGQPKSASCSDVRQQIPFINKLFEVAA